MDLGLYYCDMFFCDPIGKTTANWWLGFKYFSVLSLRHKTFDTAIQSSSDFVREFEVLYYQRVPSRIHFVRHSIHLLTHIAPADHQRSSTGLLCTVDNGNSYREPGGKKSDKTKTLIKNLEEHRVLRAQLDSVMAMYPKLDINHGTPSQFNHAQCLFSGQVCLSTMM